MTRLHADALKLVARAATLLFVNGQTTEQTMLAAERLGRALGVPLTLHPRWGELELRLDGAPHSVLVPATPLGVDMAKVPAVMRIVDQVRDGMLSGAAAASALAAVAKMRPASTLHFALFAAVGAASLGVIYGVLDAASLLLMAFSAGLGVLLRRPLATLGSNPYVQPLCAAALAGVIGAIATRLPFPGTQLFITLCPCMILIPGPHILEGALDLARARAALGIARLTHAGMIVLMTCAGVLAGLAAGGATLPASGAFPPVSLAADVIAAGFAVAAFGTFFSTPWRLLALPIVVGMLAHAVRWALISLAGAHVMVGALGACVLVALVISPLAARLRLPFASLGFCAVVSMMPGFYLCRAASALVELVASRQRAPVDLLSDAFANGTNAFLIILAMSFGLIVPHMLYRYFRPSRAEQRPAQG